MQDNSRKNRIINKINDLKAQILELGSQIEQERNENNEEDTAIRQELLDKREILEQQILELQNGLTLASNSAELPADLGKTFTIDMNGSSRELTIVLPDEANPSMGSISIDSPIAKALLGKKQGEIASVSTPMGNQQYLIKKVV
ncbi:MAG: GreA/GreB family elongation factor [Candidatus Dojkabacteria bacterium]|uniref:Transcription elongation factor GreA n=1 Tax=candidate division WS6 bacterium OLB21 TaxID=1617427 RepID=A0A136KJJ0_9BACT|nr:MAG: Transcription elongation factor GreA [candidate division WS6 bacterium OLB21]WKZ28349.1 MAG: GreA/GreB family elongation factor [Candidatus Dojkabacteria bacterium]